MTEYFKQVSKIKKFMNFLWLHPYANICVLSNLGTDTHFQLENMLQPRAFRLQPAQNGIVQESNNGQCYTTDNVCHPFTTFDDKQLTFYFIYSVVKKEEYDARRAQEPKGADDDIIEISNPYDANKTKEPTKRKPGRPRKNDPVRTKPPLNPVRKQFATKTIDQRVTRIHKKSQLKQAPYTTP